jgi:hypothetical protein
MAAEFTFIRNDRFSTKSHQESFPHKLDTDNSDERESVLLPKIWYLP